MTGPSKIILAWSGGKDSCLALYELLRSEEFQIVSLLTTVTRDYARISMHGVRQELLEAQSASLRLPLDRVLIPKGADNRTYEAAMAEALLSWRERGVMRIAFGDLFLEDVRAYRERMLAPLGIEALFPLWRRDTRECAHLFLKLGFRAVVVCADASKLEAHFTGREYDESFLRDLPEGIDPCGENGEFHTFVYDGPLFSEAIRFTIGERVERDGFHFCDLVPQA
ncbi:MAG: diphthine--ammonia ligase [Pyrinomonas methylaliphatogenes]|nr:diphthine--ammonia ligase [Pyrinomonas methylaliphatogenes]